MDAWQCVAEAVEAYVASTHIALIDMLVDTISTLLHERQALPTNDLDGIDRLNNQIIEAIRDLDQAVRFPAAAVQSSSIQVELDTLS